MHLKSWYANMLANKFINYGTISGGSFQLCFGLHHLISALTLVFADNRRLLPLKQIRVMSHAEFALCVVDDYKRFHATHIKTD